MSLRTRSVGMCQDELNSGIVEGRGMFSKEAIQIKLFLKKSVIKLLSFKGIDLDWYYSRHNQKL